MKPILINGNFLARNLTGIERLAFCLLEELDLLAKDYDISILVPKNAKTIPCYKNIAMIHSRFCAKCFPLWDHVIFFFACVFHKKMSLDFSNTTPFFCPGVAFLHDIYFKLFAEDAKTLKEKLVGIYSRLMYRTISKRAKKVLTVSFASKNDIQRLYGTQEERIAVIPNGYDHFSKIKEDESVFSSFPNIRKGKYFFTLGSLSKRKNLSWLFEVAKKNTQYTFVVSGKAISCLKVEGMQNSLEIPNLIFTGYIEDEKVKALMTHSLAFIFPSYYEGFGIPPLEAASCGAKLIVSNIPVMKEIFGTAASYIDPYNSDVDMAKLLETPLCSYSKVLEKYTYHNSAGLLLEALKNIS